MIKIKRVYDEIEPKDGRLYLVDRLWPRGKSKRDLKGDTWVKEIAPSTALRKQFHSGTVTWVEFKKRYLKELKSMDPKIWEPLVKAAKAGTITLLYAAKDPVQNHAVVLKDFLSGR